MVSRLLHLSIIDILATGVALRLGSAQSNTAIKTVPTNRL